MEDKEIVSRILSKGDVGSYRLVVEKYSGLLYSKALGILKRHDMAQDIVQQTFIQAYQRLDDCHSPQLGPWLSAIAVHLSLNALYKERRMKTTGMEHMLNISDDTAYDEQKEARLLQLEQIMEELPPADNELLRLFYYKRMATADIAKKLNMSQSNVLVRIHRLRNKIRQSLQNTQ